MRQLVADDVGAVGERAEDLAVTVAEDHLLAVPEGVVVVLGEVDRGDERQTRAVEGVAPVGLVQEGPRRAEPVVGLADLAVTEPATFAAIVATAKAALPADTSAPKVNA